MLMTRHKNRWGQPAPAPTRPRGLEDMTVAELRDLAAERGVDLGKARKKRDIIAALEAPSAARESAAEPADRGDDVAE